MDELIQRIRNKENLTQDEIQEVMQVIMKGEASKEQIADFLLALRSKGATVDEITGAAKVMRQFVVKIPTKHTTVLDTCGTGGDKKNTFNISTLTAFVVAGAGVAVAKHGNRSVSSKCGSADILEGLGLNLNVEHDRLQECLDTVGIAFLFAQKHHPAMKYVAPVRKELGVETIFNILGPLTNPAAATHQMLGVYNRDLVAPMATVLGNLGLKRAIVVHGSDGLDEVTTTASTFVSEYQNGELISYDVSPVELGVDVAKDEDLLGGDLKRNIEIFENILKGGGGPKRDIVLVNSAFALYAAEKVDNIEKGLTLAKESLQSGAALQKLEDLKVFTQS